MAEDRDLQRQTGVEKGAERVIQTSGSLFITGNIGERTSAHPLKGKCKYVKVKKTFQIWG